MPYLRVLLLIFVGALLQARALAGQIDPDLPVISYVQYQALNLLDPGNP